jgi:hypothetical protein
VSVEVTGGDLVVRIKPRKQAGDEFTEVEVEVMHASLRGEKVLSPGELQDFNTAADDPHQVYDVTLPNPQPTVIKNTIVALDTIVTVDGVSWEAGQTFSARPS